MVTDMNKLRGKIIEKGFTHEAIAEAIKVNKSTFYRKMRMNGLSFSVGEIHKIVETLSLTPDEAKDIFLSSNSH